MYQQLDQLELVQCDYRQGLIAQESGCMMIPTCCIIVSKSTTKVGQKPNDFGKSGRAMMGGYGSTRWGSHSRRETVEECLTLDVNRFVLRPILQKRIDWMGSLTWSNTRTKELVASVGYRLMFHDAVATLALDYAVTPSSDFSSPIERSGLHGTSYTLNQSLPQGSYCWHMASVDAATNKGDWSDPSIFDLNIQISPPNGTFFVTKSPPARVLFRWAAVPGASGYELEVFNGDDCTTLRYNVPLTTTNHILPLASALPHGIYSWRVNLALGSGLVTSPYCWLLIVTPSAPPRPSLATPANAAVVPTATPTLTWNAVTYATAITYYLQVDNNSNFSSPEVNVVVSTTSHTIAAPLPEGTYYWRVHALNNLNLGGLFSTSRRFRVDFP